jgi:signal peptidase
VTRWLKPAIVAVHLAAWAALLWPQALGGNISYVMVVGSSMEPGLHTGDLVAVRKADHYEVGDVIAFRVPEGQPGAGATVIHRITGGTATAGYVTRGDNRDGADQWRPRPSDVVGQRWLLVPGAGWVIAGLQSPLPLATLAGLLVAWVVFGIGRRPVITIPDPPPLPADTPTA